MWASLPQPLSLEHCGHRGGPLHDPPVSVPCPPPPSGPAWKQVYPSHSKGSENLIFGGKTFLRELSVKSSARTA